MNDDHLSGLIAMWVRVFFCRTAVGRPTGMADTIGTVERAQANAFFEIAKLPFRATQFELEEDNAKLSKYSDELKAAVLKATNEEDILLVVHEIYHSV